MNRGTRLRDPVSGVLHRRDIVTSVGLGNLAISVGLGNLVISNGPVISRAAKPSLTGNSGVAKQPKDSGAAVTGVVAGVAVAEDGINGETTPWLISRNISKRVNIVTN